MLLRQIWRRASGKLLWRGWRLSRVGSRSLSGVSVVNRIVSASAPALDILGGPLYSGVHSMKVDVEHQTMTHTGISALVLANERLPKLRCHAHSFILMGASPISISHTLPYAYFHAHEIPLRQSSYPGRPPAPIISSLTRNPLPPSLYYSSP